MKSLLAFIGVFFVISTAQAAADKELGLRDLRDELCGRASNSLSLCVLQSLSSKQRYIQIITLHERNYYAPVTEFPSNNKNERIFRGSYIYFSDDSLNIYERVIELKATFTPKGNKQDIRGNLTINAERAGDENFEMDTWFH